MQKGLGLGMVLVSAAFSVAQAQYPSGGAAPVVQSYPTQGSPAAQGYPGNTAGQGYGAPAQAAPRVFDLQPNAGVSVRGDVSGGVETVAATNMLTELRVTQGRADVMVHHPTDRSEILVDLPNGQISLLKDGLYTFNAGTNTVRVLHGEAEAFNGPRDGAKGVKVKETQQLTLIDNFKLKSVNAYPYELTADLVGGGNHGDAGYGDGGYGDGFYGPGPYYGGLYGYPYGYGFYPYGYGWGYPVGIGFGFGYGGYGRGFGGGYGGFHGGGGRR